MTWASNSREACIDSIQPSRISGHVLDGALTKAAPSGLISLPRDRAAPTHDGSVRGEYRDSTDAGGPMSEAIPGTDRLEPYRKSVSDVLAEFGTDARFGLSEAEARARLERYGRNAL